MHRRTVRRLAYRRRRHNPASIGGIRLPDFGNVLTGVAGGVGSKILGRTVFPQAVTMFGGWGGPLLTLGTGIALGFVLPMLGLRRFAGAVVTGAATIAAYDAVKLTPLAPQLGIYTAPGDMTPVFNGVGAYPAGFMDPGLSLGNTNEPSGFEMSPY